MSAALRAAMAKSADVEKRIPVRAVAGEPRHVDRQHEPDLVQTHARGQFQEASPIQGGRSTQPKVGVDDVNVALPPTEVLGPMLQRVLEPKAFLNRDDLARRAVPPARPGRLGLHLLAFGAANAKRPRLRGVLAIGSPEASARARERFQTATSSPAAAQRTRHRSCPFQRCLCAYCLAPIRVVFEISPHAEGRGPALTTGALLLIEGDCVGAVTPAPRTTIAGRPEPSLRCPGRRILLFAGRSPNGCPRPGGWRSSARCRRRRRRARARSCRRRIC